MENEFLVLNKSQVEIITALNSVHRSQNFHPWTIKGQKNFYLFKSFLTNDSIPEDFKNFFKTLKSVKVENPEINLIRLDDFSSFDNYSIRAAYNPYNGKFLPSHLYHYTSSNGLLGIITSKKLWATHYAFLNDYNEFEYAKKLIKKILLNHLNDSDEHEAIKNNWNLFEEQFPYYNIFLVSFSTEKDQLSQWKGYAEQGKGFSIGFKTEIIGLSTPPKHRTNSFTIRPVLYDLKSQEHIINEAIEQTFKDMTKDEESFRSPNHYPQRFFKIGIGEYKNPLHYARVFYKILHWNCLYPIVSFKSEHFKEEKEWRVVHVQTKFDSQFPTNLEIKFRSSLGEIIPYIEISLNAEVGDPRSKFPLTEIVYGPTLNDLMTSKSLELLCSKELRGSQVKITKSNLTLR